MVHSTLRIGLLAFGALALAGAAAHATNNDSDLNCGITTQAERGLLAIEGVVQSPTALTGEYRFVLKSQGAGGTSNISQGGQFSLSPGAPVSLGKVMVNASASIDIDFTISADGKRLDCSAPLITHT